MANGIVDSFCRPCIYAGRNQCTKAPGTCDYYLLTGKRRPCPAGKGCTVRDTSKKARVQIRIGKRPRTVATHCPVCGAVIADRRFSRCKVCAALLV